MAELLAKKKEIKLLPSITDGRLGYLEINEDKMRFTDAMKGGKAVGGNEGMTLRAIRLRILFAKMIDLDSLQVLLAALSEGECWNNGDRPEHQS
jgi:hypothetical protein